MVGFVRGKVRGGGRLGVGYQHSMRLAVAFVSDYYIPQQVKRSCEGPRSTVPASPLQFRRGSTPASGPQREAA